jgi:hypothetical protein
MSRCKNSKMGLRCLLGLRSHVTSMRAKVPGRNRGWGCARRINTRNVEAIRFEGNIRVQGSGRECVTRRAAVATPDFLRDSIRFEEITRVQDAYWKMRSKDAHHTINP